MRNALVLVAGMMLVARAGEPEPTPVERELKRVAAWSVEDLLALKQGIDRILLERLLTPAPEHVRQFVLEPAVKVTRLLQRGLLDSVKEPRGGGAYFSFETESHSYNEKPDIELQHGRFHSGFAGGDFGLVYGVDVKSVTDVADKHLPGLFTLDPGEFYKQGRGVRDRPAAKVGAVYVIRSVRWRQTDLVAAFEVLEADKYGVTIAWKLMSKSAVGARR